MEVSDEVDDEEAIDEFFNNSTHTFEETINVGIVDSEFVDFTTESPFEEEEDEFEEDLDDEFYRKGYIEDSHLEQIRRNISE